MYFCFIIIALNYMLAELNKFIMYQYERNVMPYRIII